jgi:Leucine-rich repeat (LRR) protein
MLHQHSTFNIQYCDPSFFSSMQPNAKKKGGGKGKTKTKNKDQTRPPKSNAKKQASSDTKQGSNETKAPTPQPPPSLFDDPLSDPWGKHKFQSQFGGKMSPAEEWDKLRSSYLTPLTAVIQREEVRAHCGKNGGTLLGKLVDQSCFCSKMDASLTVTSEDGSSQVATATKIETGIGHTVTTTTLISSSSAPELDAKFAQRFAQRILVCSADLVGLIPSSSMRQNLVSLNLTDNRLKDLIILGECWLRELNVTANQLSEIPNMMQFPKLLSLNLSHNPIANIQSTSFEALNICDGIVA